MNMNLLLLRKPRIFNLLKGLLLPKLGNKSTCGNKGETILESKACDPERSHELLQEVEGLEDTLDQESQLNTISVGNL